MAGSQCSYMNTVRLFPGATCSGRNLSSAVVRAPVAFPSTLRSLTRKTLPCIDSIGSNSRIRATPGVSSGPGMAPELKQAIEEYLEANKVVLFMKGTKQFPQCGFSNTCVQILNTMSVPFETVNVLEDESLRAGMKEFSQWPTFPQLYVNAEFVGGCDIMIESYQNGELQEMMEVALNS